MPANTNPVFGLTANFGPVAITAALTKSDGTATGIATDIFKAFATGASGSWISKVRFSPCATTANTATTATIGRVYLSTQSSGATTGGTNTWLIAEVTLAAQTADSSTAATNPIDVPLNIAVQTGYYVLVSTHHAPAANSSWQAEVFGTDY